MTDVATWARAYQRAWQDADAEAAGAEEDVVHFRTELVNDPTAGRVDGVLAVRLAPDGRCTAPREWWPTDSRA